MCTIESLGVAAILEKTKLLSEGVNYTNSDVDTLRWQHIVCPHTHTSDGMLINIVIFLHKEKRNTFFVNYR